MSYQNSVSYEGKIVSVIENEEAKFIKLKSEGEKKAKAKNKTKYVCTGCETNIWGKAGLNLHCNECDMDFEEDV